MTAKKVAVVLAGCGHRDGSEITEAVSTLVSLDRHQAAVECFAPDIEVPEISHLSQRSQGSTLRNLWVEAARIARGQVKELGDLQVEDFDALVFPGGTGIAHHLFTYAKDGAGCTVLPRVEKLITQFHEQKKPIGAICIAPVLIAKILGVHKVTLTVGPEEGPVSRDIVKWGAFFVPSPVTDFVSDRTQRVLSTPAYMVPQATPFEVFTGISGLIKELVEMS